MSKMPIVSSRFRTPRGMRPRVRVPRKLPRIAFITTVLVLALLGARWLWQKGIPQRLFSRPTKVENLVPLADRLDQALRNALEELDASPIFVTQSDTIIVQENVRWRWRQINVRVTDQISLLACNLAITREIQAAGGHINSGEQAPGGKSLILEIGADGVTTHLLKLIPDKNISPTRGRLAIIIDDFGAINNQDAEAFLGLPIPRTVAVIPGHETSQQIARQAAAAGHEVFVHLAMEPKEGTVGEENAILVDLPEDEIRRRVRWALAEIPQAVGVNNHMGSLATENEKVMRAVLEEIKIQKKFFVDSRTSSASVAEEVARKLSLLCTRSDGFLDYQDNGADIERNLDALAEKALKEGTAIGIGHIKANTLQVLKNSFARLESRGVRFAHVSDVL